MTNGMPVVRSIYNLVLHVECGLMKDSPAFHFEARSERLRELLVEKTLF